MTEIWKEIKDYEDYYEVSNLGNFRSKNRVIKYKQNGTRNYPGKSLKTETIIEGYQRIVLMKESIKKRYMCHRLVAQTFIPNPSNKPFVNHINGNPKDNRVCNLEWCTQEENEYHAIHTLHKIMVRKTYPKSIKCIELDKEFKSMRQCILFLGNRACIEGLNKAIRSNRKYHNYTFIRTNETPLITGNS